MLHAFGHQVVPNVARVCVVVVLITGGVLVTSVCVCVCVCVCVFGVYTIVGVFRSVVQCSRFTEHLQYGERAN